jgi:hypothetical protein
MLAGRIASIAQRHARWGSATEAELAAGSAELRELAAGRGDLLAEAAGIALGFSEGRGPEYAARAQAIADLCRLAGADQTLIPQWVQTGRERAAQARMPPFSGGVRPLAGGRGCQASCKMRSRVTFATAGTAVSNAVRSALAATA